MGTTTRVYATMPHTIDGTPLSTSAPKRIHQLTRSAPYSDRYDASHHADGDANERRQCQQGQCSHNGIGHSHHQPRLPVWGVG